MGLGLSLVAILTGALILPGIFGTFLFFRAARTREVDLPVPPLNSAEGIALVGGFSLAGHAAYSAVLWTLAQLPPWIDLPLADPYLFFSRSSVLEGRSDSLILFFGLIGVSVTASIIGRLFGRTVSVVGDGSYFYGPLAEVLRKGEGPQRFITAYVLTKIENESRIVGYEGTVVAMSRDANRFPSAVVLRGASIFYLDIGSDEATRTEVEKNIDWLALTADNWHNIAFEVYELSEE